MTISRVVSNFILIVFTVLVTVTSAVAEDVQQSDAGAAHRKLRGVYALVATGTKGVPFAAVGLFRPKRDGTFDGQAIDNFFGETVTDTFQGTLKFDSCSTGTLTLTTSGNETFTKSFVVMDRGKQIWFESTDPGEVELVTGTRQINRRTFTTRHLSGTWAFACNGSETNQQTGVAGPVTSLGTLSRDGAGNFSGSGTYNRNGAIVGATFTGTSTVNSDGTFSNSGQYTNGLQGNFADSGVIQNESQLAAISTSSHGAIACSYKRLGR